MIETGPAIFALISLRGQAFVSKGLRRIEWAPHAATTAVQHVRVIIVVRTSRWPS